MLSEPDASPDSGSRWPIVKVFHLVAAVLVVAVAVRAVGGVVSGLDVPTVHLNFGSTSGTGLTIKQSDFGIPTYIRLEYGTAWADLASAILMLAGLALLALPRLIWDVPPKSRDEGCPESSHRRTRGLFGCYGSQRGERGRPDLAHRPDQPVHRGTHRGPRNFCDPACRTHGHSFLVRSPVRGGRTPLVIEHSLIRTRRATAAVRWRA